MTDEKRNILNLISRNVHEIDPKSVVILFGSRARGDEAPESDWDILILTENPVTLKDEQRFRHHLINLELELGEAFSTFVYQKSVWESKHHVTPFYQNIKNEGIRI